MSTLSDDKEVARATVRSASVSPAVPASKTFLDPTATAIVAFYSVSTITNTLRVSAIGRGVVANLNPWGWSALVFGDLNSFYTWDGSKIVGWGTSGVPGQPFDQITLSSNGPVVGPSTTAANPSQSNTPTPGASASAIESAGASTGSNVSASPSAAANGTATSTTAPVSKGHDVTSGVAAGIAIGCLLAGILIAGLVFWLCGRKRKPTRSHDYEASRTALVPQEKGFATSAIPLGSRTATASPLMDVLPLPLEDKAVAGEISKISLSVKNHVQSYYHASRVNAASLDLDDIQGLGNNLPISAGTLSTLLDNAATREIALRFCIAWVVCSKILPSTGSRATLLPAEVAECSRSIASARGSASARTPTFARWRVLTAELMQPSYVLDPFSPSDSRNISITQALDTLENILRPYADSRMDNGERKRNLEEILKRSALFAFTLFSQPSTWKFDWKEQQGVNSGELCIFPALVQLSDETGQPVSPPRPFSEAVVRRLDA